MEAMTVTQLGSLYEVFRTHGFLNVYAVKHSPRFGPALVNFSVQDLINRVNADLLALTQPPLVIQDANTRWVEAEIPPAYLGMHYLGNADAVKHFDLYNQHIPNRTPAAIKSKLRYFRRKFQVNEWQAAYVNNHVHNPFNLPVVQQNIQNLAAQVAELQNQLNLLQQQAFQQHNPGPQNPPGPQIPPQPQNPPGPQNPPPPQNPPANVLNTFGNFIQGFFNWFIPVMI